MAIEDRNLTVGTRLVANYKKQAVACAVEKAKEGDGVLLVLSELRAFQARRQADSEAGPGLGDQLRHQG